jgi:RNA polymerase sigma factor (sigma-70 family)
MPTAAEFSALYRRHASTVYRRARQILGNASDAHEVTQDLFVSLFEKPEQFSAASSFTTFLYAATTNACLNRLRNSKNRERLLAEHVTTLETASDSLSAEQLLVLQRALLEMPDELARAAVYYCLDGLSHEEIARVLSCSRRQVGNLLQRVIGWGVSQERNHAQ